MKYSDYLKHRRIYQEEGHMLLIERKHACLFYKPGKGKTYPCIDALRDVAPNGNILILSTADAIKRMWKTDILPQNILPKRTEMLSFTAAIQERTKVRLLKNKYDVIIVDESHKIKSHNSKISKLVYMLTKKVPYAWGLTGTPRGNNDLDIFCQFHNLNIGFFGDISYSRFVEDCCDVETKFFGGRSFKIPLGINEKYRAGWETNVCMYSQRIDYTEDDNMPELKSTQIRLPYVKTDEYKLAEKGCISVGDYATTMQKMVATQKLHQAVNGYLYLEDGIIHRFQRNAKLDWLKQNLNGEPTLIVYRHIADREDLQKEFPYSTESIDDFKNGKSKLLLLQCSRCESFNLQMCRKVIFYTLDYSYVKYNQMLHRCWRLEQERVVDVIVLLFENSIEEKIWHTVKHKEKLADLFMSIKQDLINNL